MTYAEVAIVALASRWDAEPVGIKGEMSAIHLTVRRDGKEKSLIVNRMDDLEEIVRKTFIEE